MRTLGAVGRLRQLRDTSRTACSKWRSGYGDALRFMAHESMSFHHLDDIFLSAPLLRSLSLPTAHLRFEEH
jgi:phosphodiesterase/alkaline phosphatase D-like protein